MEEVGCAYAVCDENSFAPNVANGIWTFIVCNYNPSAKAEDPVYTPCFDEPCNLDPNDEETTGFFSTPDLTISDISTPDISTPDLSVSDVTSVDISTGLSTEDSTDSSDLFGSVSLGLGDDDDSFASVITMSLFVCGLALMF